MESTADQLQAESAAENNPVNQMISNLGRRVERRVVRTVHRGGWVLQQHAHAIVCRATQTLRRSTIIMSLLFLGALLVTASWVILNMAVHLWLLKLSSPAMANLVIAGMNLLVGGAAIITAVVMTAVPPAPLVLPSRIRRRAIVQAQAQAQPAPTQVAPPPPQNVYAQPTIAQEADELQDALGATFELGIQASRTIPLLVRALRKR